jgi:hypothetical protein
MRLTKKFSLSITAIALSIVGMSFAQTVSTPIVGFQKSTLPLNAYTGLGFPLLNPAILSGNISSKSSTTITVSGSSLIGSQLQSGVPYYIEVTSTLNNLVGNRFDVDVVATKAVNNSNVVLDSTSPRNTASALLTDLTGATITIRRHVTLDQIRQSITGTLVGDDSTANNADSVAIYNGVGFVTYWLGSDLQSWLSNDDPDDHRYEVIAPGQGILFKKKGASANIVSSGTVRANDYRQVLAPGYQFSAPGFPLGYSPDALGGAISNGWSAGDSILVYGGVGFSEYTLLSDGSWTDQASPDSFNTVTIVSGDGAFMTKMKSGVVDIETKPIQ